MLLKRLFPPKKLQAGYLMLVLVKSQHGRGTQKQNSQGVLDPTKGRSQLWGGCVAVGCDKSGFDHLSKHCHLPRSLGEAKSISTRDLPAPASKKPQTPNSPAGGDIATSPGTGQRSSTNSPCSGAVGALSR